MNKFYTAFIKNNCYRQIDYNDIEAGEFYKFYKIRNEFIVKHKKEDEKENFESVALLTPYQITILCEYLDNNGYKTIDRERLLRLYSDVSDSLSRDQKILNFLRTYNDVLNYISNDSKLNKLINFK